MPDGHIVCKVYYKKGWSLSLLPKHYGGDLRKSWHNGASIGASSHGLSHPWKLVECLAFQRRLKNSMKDYVLSIEGSIFMPTLW